MTDTYTCDVCGRTLEKGRSDEEALEESRHLFGDVPQDELGVVCDTCFKRMFPE